MLLDGSEGGHGHSHGAEGAREHDALMWKAMIVVVGIYAFFLTERITIIVQNNSAKRKLKKIEVCNLLFGTFAHTFSAPYFIIPCIVFFKRRN